MIMKRWCLGFVFSFDLRQVTLLRKGRSLHTGLWNGVGGTLEKDDLGSSLNAMIRECEEETKIRIHSNRWVEVGVLYGDVRSWSVNIYAARLSTDVIKPDTLWADTETVIQDPSCINDYEVDQAVLIPIELLPVMKMAPYGAVLALAALERLRDGTSVITIDS